MTSAGVGRMLNMASYLEAKEQSQGKINYVDLRAYEKYITPFKPCLPMVLSHSEQKVGAGGVLEEGYLVAAYFQVDLKVMPKNGVSAAKVRLAAYPEALVFERVMVALHAGELLYSYDQDGFMASTIAAKCCKLRRCGAAQSINTRLYVPLLLGYAGRAVRIPKLELTIKEAARRTYAIIGGGASDFCEEVKWQLYAQYVVFPGYIERAMSEVNFACMRYIIKHEWAIVDQLKFEGDMPVVDSNMVIENIHVIAKSEANYMRSQQWYVGTPCEISIDSQVLNSGQSAMLTTLQGREPGVENYVQFCAAAVVGSNPSGFMHTAESIEARFDAPFTGDLIVILTCVGLVHHDSCVKFRYS